MPRYRQIASDFAAGEIAPGAQDRVDSQIARSAAETLDNVLVRREGGVRTRPGLRSLVQRGATETRTDTRISILREEVSALAGQPWQPHETSAVWRGNFRGAFDLPGVTQQSAGVPTGLTLPAAPDPQGWLPVRIGADPWTTGRWRDTDAASGDATRGYTGMLDGRAVTNEPAMALAVFDCAAYPLTSLGLLDLQLIEGGAWDKATRRVSLTLWGQVLGLAGWYRLTSPRNAAFTGSLPVLDVLTGNTVQPYRYETRSQTLQLAPALATPVSTATTPTVYVQPKGTTGVADAIGPGRPNQVAYAKIALMAEHTNTTSTPWLGRNLQVRLGAVRASFRASSGYDADDSNPQSTRADRRLRQRPPRRDLLDELLAQVQRIDEVRVVQTGAIAGTGVRTQGWEFTPGRHALLILHAAGIRICEVPDDEPALDVRRDLDLDLSDALATLTVSASPHGVYLFHASLVPRRIVWDETRELFAMENAPGLNVAADTPTDTSNVPLWGSPGNDWPRAGRIAHGRLVLVGSRTHPQMVAFSKVGDFATFKPPTANATDADAFWVTQAAGAGALHALIDHRRLIFLGEEGELYAESERLSGATLSIAQSSRHGSLPGAPTTVLADVACFVQGNGGDVRAMVFSDEEKGFRTPSMAPWAAHRVRDVVDMAYQPGNVDSAAARLWVVHESGDMSVLTAERASGVNAWTGVSFPPGIRARGVAVTGRRVLVTLVVGEAGSPEIAELSYRPSGAMMDLAEVYDPFRGAPPKVSPSLLRWLAGQTEPRVAVAAGADWIEGCAVDPDTGEVLLPEGEDWSHWTNERVEVGLPVRWTVRTLGIAIRTPSGTMVSVQKSRVLKLVADFETEDDASFRPGRRLIVQPGAMWGPDRQHPPERLVVEGRERRFLRVVRDTGRIVRARLGPRRGWRDRNAVDIAGRTPATLVGLSWIVAGGG